MEFRVSRENRYKAGIYRISNTLDSRVYIGSSERFKARYTSHKTSLLVDIRKSANIKLFNFVKKYGFDKLIFEVVEVIEDLSTLTSIEQRYLDELFSGPIENVFNVSRTAINVGYMNLKQEGYVGRKISKALKGRKKPPTYTENFSLAKGRPIGRFTKSGMLVEEFQTNLFLVRAGFDSECVRRVCVGERNSYLGFCWAYTTDENLNPISLDEIRQRLIKTAMRPERPVHLFDIDGNFLETFLNCGEASKKFGFKSHSIREACKRERPFLSKYIFLYEDHSLPKNLTREALSKILSIRFYAGYSPEGELIVPATSESGLKRLFKYSGSKICYSAIHGKLYNGLFWEKVYE